MVVQVDKYFLTSWCLCARWYRRGQPNGTIDCIEHWRVAMQRSSHSGEMLADVKLTVDSLRSAYRSFGQCNTVKAYAIAVMQQLRQRYFVRCAEWSELTLVLLRQWGDEVRANCRQYSDAIRANHFLWWAITTLRNESAKSVTEVWLLSSRCGICLDSTN
jgi:hypothetical protein